MPTASSGCYSHDMANLQIKDVPDAVHDELRRRARQAGSSMRDYVLDLVVTDQQGPTRAEWLARLRARPRIDLGGAASELVAADRKQRDRA